MRNWLDRTITPGVGWAALGRSLVIVLGLVWHGGCNSLVTSTRSATVLVIERIAAAAGGQGTLTFQTVLQSDVQTNGGIFEDIGRVSTRLGFKDPGIPSNPTSPTSANWVTITRYRVVFKRADGRNTPGVDVPFPFDGAMTFTTVDIGSAEFTMVRAQSKLEPPLLALRGVGGAAVISTIAEITFYGHDQTGAAITATGTIGVNFADWADPEG